MTAPGGRSLLDRVFDAMIGLKGLNGVLELLGGLALLIIDIEHLRMLRWVSVHAFVSHPDSAIAQWMNAFADRLGADSADFAGWYLMLHGAIKIAMVWALLKQKLWAYPWTLVVIAGFIVYQSYEIIFHFTWMMVLLTVFDLVVIWLTWREWQEQKTRLGAPSPESSPVEG